ncbi:MAG: amidohydrolase [candidate division Zixibacteria bacterium]|nr:amidohydrolase [candidate division Zixibacteria bacterium]
MKIEDKIKSLSREFYPSLVKLRRELHQYPEIAYTEYKTSGIVARELRKLGIEVKIGVARTGVVSLLNKNKKGKTVALRADMDALPVTEMTNLPFKSKNPGRMHACGHDVHMSCVIGAAKILSKLKDELPGKVKFIFQPSEEVTPGGAYPMIKAGVLKNPEVNGIFGLHSDSAIPIGKIGVKNGPMMAQADDFDITIIGQGGHGARPQDGIDAIVVASAVIQALQTIPSRRISPLKSVVISIGSIEGGTARNIICDKVVLKGTARTLEKGITEKIPRLLKEIVAGVTQGYGADFELNYYEGYPVLVNNPDMTDLVRDSVINLFGREALFEVKEPMMGGEDFAYFLKEVQGSFIRVGIRNEKIGAVHPWHHPEWKVDEKAIEIGSALLAQVAFDFLKQL